MTTVFIISAPSGSGKSTLVRRLLANVPGGLTITDLALAAKAEIDKLREQSLNLE